MTKYLMAVYGPADISEYGGYPSEAEMNQSFADTGAFNDRLQEQGYWVFADGLASATESVVVDGQRDSPLVTDGPYQETKEYLAGFWVIDVPDHDTALRLAAEGSKACRGKVELRAFGTLPA